MKKAIAIFENLYKNARLLSDKKNTTLYLSSEVTLNARYNIRKSLHQKRSPHNNEKKRLQA